VVPQRQGNAGEPLAERPLCRRGRRDAGNRMRRRKAQPFRSARRRVLPGVFRFRNGPLAAGVPRLRRHRNRLCAPGMRRQGVYDRDRRRRGGLSFVEDRSCSLRGSRVGKSHLYRLCKPNLLGAQQPLVYRWSAFSGCSFRSSGGFRLRWRKVASRGAGRFHGLCLAAGHRRQISAYTLPHTLLRLLRGRRAFCIMSTRGRQVGS